MPKGSRGGGQWTRGGAKPAATKPKATKPKAKPRAPKKAIGPGDKVVIDNGGTYDGQTVQVVRVEKDGNLIVKHPRGGSNMLRLQTARTSATGIKVQAQFRLPKGKG